MLNNSAFHSSIHSFFYLFIYSFVYFIYFNLFIYFLFTFFLFYLFNYLFYFFKVEAEGGTSCLRDLTPQGTFFWRLNFRNQASMFPIER